LHHKIYKGKEFFQFSELIGLFRLFKYVEPAFSNIVKARFDNFLKAENPSRLTSSKFDLTDAAVLVLLKLLHTHSFVQLHVEDSVITHHIVAIFTDLYHRFDHLVSNEKRVETKVTERFRELVLWNRYLTEVRTGLRRSRRA